MTSWATLYKECKSAGSGPWSCLIQKQRLGVREGDGLVHHDLILLPRSLLLIAVLAAGDAVACGGEQPVEAALQGRLILVQSGAATSSEGFVNYFLRVP